MKTIEVLSEIKVLVHEKKTKALRSGHRIEKEGALHCGSDQLKMITNALHGGRDKTTTTKYADVPCDSGDDTTNTTTDRSNRADKATNPRSARKF